MKQIELANRLNITRQTLKNWEKTKPELIKLIRLGLNADKRYLEFFDLFPNMRLGFFMMDNTYIDFYMKFLNYFRKNITNPSQQYNMGNTDMNSTFIYYLMNHTIEELFDKSLNINEFSLSSFQRPEFQKPLCNINIDLSTYILTNTIDDFETLIQDTMNQSKSNDELFLYALYFSIYYLIYKYQPSLSFHEKENLRQKIYKQIGINKLSKNNSAMDQYKIFNKYLIFRENYAIEHIDQIENELTLYTNNDFYVPTYIQKLTST